MTKLAFKFAEPEHVVIPIKMSREKWFALAERQNELRGEALQRRWPQFQTEEVYAELHPA
jgi:hypothetical protein